MGLIITDMFHLVVRWTARKWSFVSFTLTSFTYRTESSLHKVIVSTGSTQYTLWIARAKCTHMTERWTIEQTTWIRMWFQLVLKFWKDECESRWHWKGIEWLIVKLLSLNVFMTLPGYFCTVLWWQSGQSHASSWILAFYSRFQGRLGLMQVFVE
jgi:hypothetical protein